MLSDTEYRPSRRSHPDAAREGQSITFAKTISEGARPLKGQLS